MEHICPTSGAQEESSRTRKNRDTCQDGSAYLRSNRFVGTQWTHTGYAASVAISPLDSTNTFFDANFGTAYPFALDTAGDAKTRTLLLAGRLN